MDSMSFTISEGVQQKAVDGICQYLAHLKFITSDINIRSETVKVQCLFSKIQQAVVYVCFQNVESFINSVSNLYVAWGYNVLVL